MANFTQNLSDSLRLFGVSTKWGSPMLWGTDKWGENAPNNLLPTVSKTMQSETQSFSDLFSASYVSRRSETLTFIHGSGSFEGLLSGMYNYVFKGGSINDENAFTPTYTLSTTASNTWVLTNTVSNTWTVST